MKWLEKIELRSGQKRWLTVKDELIKLKYHYQSKCDVQIELFRHAFVDSDLSVFVFHQSDQAEPFESPIGQQISVMLEEFGMVSHSIWINEPIMEKKET